MPVLSVSMSLELANLIDDAREQTGFRSGALIFKRSPFICALIQIGLNHKGELNNGSK